MPQHPDFQKIHKKFVQQYGKKGESYYFAWLKKKGYDDTKAFPKEDKNEKREINCIVNGVEVREYMGDFYLEGVIASSHVYPVPGDDFPEYIPKETLEAMAEQLNTIERTRIMGLHHSEGRTGEFFGRAAVDSHPAKVVPTTDGEYALYVVTRMNHEAGAEEIIKGYQTGDLNSFSITFDASTNEDSIDFDWKGTELVKVLRPSTILAGYTAASNPVNPNAVATAFGYREFRELIPQEEPAPADATAQPIASEEPASEQQQNEDQVPLGKTAESEKLPKEETPMSETQTQEAVTSPPSVEPKFDERELISKVSESVLKEVEKKLEVREKVLKTAEEKEVPLEMREFAEVLANPAKYDVREQFIRAQKVAEKSQLWEKGTSRVETREYKHFATNGTKLEFRGLGITSNQNSDTDYLQSAAELQDVYDPVIYNALNQQTVFWNILAKDNFAGRGNNMVQFVLKTAANTTAAFYTGNSVVTDKDSRLKNQTKFKKVQVGISVDGDMIAAARGGPVADVFAQEVQDATIDLLSVVNQKLFGTEGAETDSGVIGLQYIANSGTYTTLYSMTRSTTNRLAPTSAGDTYINASSAIFSMANARAMIRQARLEGVNKKQLVFVTNPLQGDLLRAKFDDARRLLTPRDTGFGFETDLFIDGVPVYEDKDCTNTLWFCVDLDTHRVAIWVPPTIEKLGKVGDSEDAFIKMYFAVYNRKPRALSMTYGCATS